MSVWINRDRFDELVSDALDRIPDQFADAIDNVVFLVEDCDPESRDLLGVYVGTSLGGRNSDYTGHLPDRIIVFREPILAMCDSEVEVAHEIEVTIRHEIGHYFGIDEGRLHELGWG